MSVLENDGADALTFRRLGSELGVDHTAVLRHFRNKDELLLALSNRLVAEALEGMSPSPEWRDTLRELAGRVRRACHAHPHVAVLVAGRTARRDAEFAGAEIVIGALLRAGLRGHAAASCYRALVEVALAYSALEAAMLTVPEHDRAGDRAAWSHEYRALPADRYPSIAAVAPHLAAVEEEDQFEVALDMLLDAVELRARNARDSE
ncbi:TetR/AcrR family transcriptional regulator C-terminal domain-containing protein [Nocardia blacklockiae]|nr:TetR/AcrR family transcriptional regulator C-terminal domain-containing protein [Nocardia blacklockiae]